MGCSLSPKSLVAEPTRIGLALRGSDHTLGAQGYHAKQVMNQHVPQHDRLDLLLRPELIESYWLTLIDSTDWGAT